MQTQGDGFGGSVAYERFGKAYFPALGFANRVGVETFRGGGRYRHFFRGNKLFRLMNTFMRFEQTRELATGKVQSETLFFRPFNINTNLGSQFGAGFSRNREGLDYDFQISPGVIIPAGTYTWIDYNAEINLTNQRAFAPSIQINYGDYYNGKRKRVNVGMELRPNAHFFMNVGYDFQNIDLPGGNFNVRLVSANVNYAFDSKWSWVNLIQYDNYSNNVGINSRLHWNPQAGEDLYFVLNYNFDSEGVFTNLSREKGEVALKYTKTFRF